MSEGLQSDAATFRRVYPWLALMVQGVPAGPGGSSARPRPRARSRVARTNGGDHDHESRVLAGILLIVLPSVMFGGVSILSLLIGDPAYIENPVRQDLWRAGHAHAGVWLILALVALRYVDEANLSDLMKWIVRGSIPVAAILVPAAFFLSVLSPDARAPNGLIYLAYVGAVLLAVGVLTLGVGLVRRPAQRS